VVKWSVNICTLSTNAWWFISILSVLRDQIVYGMWVRTVLCSVGSVAFDFISPPRERMGVTPQDSIRSHYILYTKHPRMLISMPVFHTMSHTNVFNQLDKYEFWCERRTRVSEPGRRAQRRIRYHPELSCTQNHTKAVKNQMHSTVFQVPMAVMGCPRYKIADVIQYKVILTNKSYEVTSWPSGEMAIGSIEMCRVRLQLR
jgi:hypothetical protein